MEDRPKGARVPVRRVRPTEEEPTGKQPTRRVQFEVAGPDGMLVKVDGPMSSAGNLAETVARLAKEMTAPTRAGLEAALVHKPAPPDLPEGGVASDRLRGSGQEPQPAPADAVGGRPGRPPVGKGGASVGKAGRGKAGPAAR